MIGGKAATVTAMLLIKTQNSHGITVAIQRHEPIGAGSLAGAGAACGRGEQSYIKARRLILHEQTGSF